jgi:hypothetical protein
MKNILAISLLIIPFISFSQSGSEIYLFDIKTVNGQVIISNGKNITNHKGYDNQPSFHPSKPIIYYSSFDDSGRSDIKYYNYETNQTSNLTITHEREYSPTVTPDEKFISCIIQRDNGDQDLAKYPIAGGKPIVLINHLRIGYHSWIDENRLLLFVLDDSVHNSLHYYELDKNADTVIAENIGRSLHKIPGETAMSFVQKITDSQYVIKKFDPNTGVITPVIYTFPNHDFFCWVAIHPPGNLKILLTSDGSKLFYYEINPKEEFKDRKWVPVKIESDAPMLKGLTRLATKFGDSKMTVVVSE